MPLKSDQSAIEFTEEETKHLAELLSPRRDDPEHSLAIVLKPETCSTCGAITAKLRRVEQ